MIVLRAVVRRGKVHGCEVWQRTARDLQLAAPERPASPAAPAAVPAALVHTGK